MADQLTIIDPLNAYGGKGLYGFGLYKKNQATGTLSPLVGLSTDDPADIILKLNPQTIQMDEPAATSLTPTLGGMNIESRGNLFKECVIQGHTGWMHGAGVTADKATLPVIGALGSQSGYADFLRLRNLFRRYWMIKAGDTNGGMEAATPKDRESVRLVFYNFKDADSWVAEPLSFSMPPRRALSYQYTIRLRLLEPFLKVKPAQLDLNRFDASTGAALSLADRARRSVEKLNGYIEGLNELPSALQAYLGGYFTVVQAGLQTLTDGLTLVANFGNLPASITKQWVSNLAASCNTLLDAANDVYGVPATFMETLLYAEEQVNGVLATAELYYDSTTARYDALRERQLDTSTLRAPMNESMPQGVATDTVVADETVFDLTRRLMGDVNRWPELVTLNNLQAPYLTTGPRQPGLLTAGDAVLYPAGKTATFTAGTMSTDATPSYPELTGSFTIPNPLPSGPFTFPVQQTLQPGVWTGYQCEIVGPSTATFDVITNDDLTVTIDEPTGFDGEAVTFRLFLPPKYAQPEDFAYGSDVAKTRGGDLRIGPDGDLVLLHGRKNFEQSLDIKVNTEQGSLPMHPWFGIMKNIGEKGNRNTVMSAVVAATQTFLSDERVAKVSDVAVGIEKDQLRVSATVHSKLHNTIAYVGGSK